MVPMLCHDGGGLATRQPRLRTTPLTHAGGTPEAKREFIATAVSRVDSPRRILHDLQVEPHGRIAVTRGTIEFIYSDARPNLYLGYVRVHRLLGDTWRALSHRSYYVVHRS